MHRNAVLLAIGLIAGWGMPAEAGAQVASGADEVLTNQLVIDMVNAKLPRNIIVARIQGTRNAFDVTAEGLVFLRQREVPEAIVSAMLLATPVRPAGELLNNDGVIALVDAKVSRNLIIAKIRNTLPAYDVSTAGLVVLQQRKVHQDIIKAMMEEASAPPRTATTPPPAPRRPGGLAG